MSQSSLKNFPEMQDLIFSLLDNKEVNVNEETAILVKGFLTMNPYVVFEESIELSRKKTKQLLFPDQKD